MANKHRGVVTFTVDDTDHDLRFGANALVEIEEVFGLEGIGEIDKVLNEKLSMKSLRTLFRIGLDDAQGGSGDVSEAQAGELMTGVGVTRAAELIQQAMQAAFPQKEGAAGTGGPRRAAKN